MIKIIKYSITFIIFSIITSLFGIYFYLLKGIDIKDIHFNNINIEKLYIKIDKKIVFKAKNINIIQKNEKKSDSKEINFKETTQILKKVLQYLSFFQEIEIRNLNINKNKINIISLYKNKFTIDTNDLFIQASLFPDKNRILFKIYELNLKQYDLILTNIKGDFYSDLLHLYINIKNIYKQAEIKINLDISNKNIKYKGNIFNVTKKFIELKPFKDQLKDIKQSDIYDIKFKGNLKNIYVTLINTQLKIKNNISIKIPALDIKYQIEKNIAKLTIPNTNIIYDNYIINLTKTNVDYKKETVFIINNSITLLDKNLKATLFNNEISYKNNIVDINTSLSDIKFKEISTIIKNMNIKYKKNIFITSPLIKIKKDKFNISLKQNNIFYNINKNSAKINNKTIKIVSPDISGIINTTNVNYKNNKVNINNNKIDVSYKTIKHIKISNVNSSFDINKSILNTKLPIMYLQNIPIKNTIINLKNNILNVNFFTNTLLSKKLNSILSVFGINISIYQSSGKNKIDANIKYDINKDKLNTNLKIDVNQSRLMLTDTTYLDIKQSHLELIDSNITLKNTDLDYNQSIVNLSYHINDGLINLNKSYISTNGKFDDLNLTDIVEIKNYPENLYIDLNDLNISLQNLKTDVVIGDDIDVYIQKISKFYPYISYLPEYGINEGKIKVKIADDIKIITNISDTNQTILENNLTPLTQLDINTTIKDDNITIYHKKLRAYIQNEPNLTIINAGYKDLDINITQFVDANKSEDNSSTNIKAKVFAKNTNIVYNDLKLYSDILHIDYNTSDAKIESLYKDRNITILYNDGALKLYGLKIKQKTFKDLTNTNILNDPLITLFALKNKDSEILQGFIEIHKGYIKELKAFTNTLAFINLIPSLVTFQAVGFTSKGYKIKHGWIEYVLYENILYFKDINVKGENLTFDGQGYIDLKKKTIKLNVNVNLIVKLVKDIPIVNYILLGKDGGITIKLTIDGDLKDPTIHKNTASNIIEAPLGIIKRALLTPFRPFMEDK